MEPEPTVIFASQITASKSTKEKWYLKKTSELPCRRLLAEPTALHTPLESEIPLRHIIPQTSFIRVRVPFGLPV